MGLQKLQAIHLRTPALTNHFKCWKCLICVNAYRWNVRRPEYRGERGGQTSILPLQKIIINQPDNNNYYYYVLIINIVRPCVSVCLSLSHLSLYNQGPGKP